MYAIDRNYNYVFFMPKIFSKDSMRFLKYSAFSQTIFYISCRFGSNFQRYRFIAASSGGISHKKLFVIYNKNEYCKNE